VQALGLVASPGSVFVPASGTPSVSPSVGSVSAKEADRKPWIQQNASYIGAGIGGFGALASVGLLWYFLRRRNANIIRSTVSVPASAGCAVVACVSVLTWCCVGMARLLGRRKCHHQGTKGLPWHRMPPLDMFPLMARARRMAVFIASHDCPFPPRNHASSGCSRASRPSKWRRLD
jgi:hypothetical protein